MKLYIINISKLVQILDPEVKFVSGKNMNNLETLSNAFLLIENGLISDYGEMKSLNIDKISFNSEVEFIDADFGMVFPCWVDSHTHLVFSDFRENEFVDRINGLSYEEINNKGGGILSSVNSIDKISENELYKISEERLKKIISLGTGAIEIKSGYGLNTNGELKMLRVIDKLKKNFPITIKSTFLGAHSIPKKYEKNRKKYIDLIINDMLPKINDKKLADFIDVFCEKDYFSVDEMRNLITHGKKFGLIPKVHINQFNDINGIKTAVELNCISVDHLEILSEKDIKILKESKTVATLLPTCSFFLNIPYSPARKLINNNIPVCLASDYNPGTSPSGNMNFVNSLGCLKMNLTPEEVINASTINGAYAIGISESEGSITRGKKGNIFITEKISSYSYLPYNYGDNSIKDIIINGKKITF